MYTLVRIWQKKSLILFRNDSLVLEIERGEEKLTVVHCLKCCSPFVGMFTFRTGHKRRLNVLYLSYVCTIKRTKYYYARKNLPGGQHDPNCRKNIWMNRPEKRNDYNKSKCAWKNVDFILPSRRFLQKNAQEAIQNV